MSRGKCVIIVAGGQGLRMGADIPKQFIPIGQWPILMHTIKKFLSWNNSLKVILVLPQNQFSYWESLCRDYDFTQEHILVAGGETRFHSVKNGLQHIGDSQLIAIHDGVRPFVSQETIERCFSAADEKGAAIPVINVSESLRKIEKNGIASVGLKRSDYRLVQTPQVFKSSIICKAYELNYNDAFTDDASVVEAAGFPIFLVEGNLENIKITTPFDLKVAEALINKT